MASSGYQDVDYVLTTRELAAMLREAGVDLSTLQPQEYDAPLGMSTGAAVIFGNTGGVMEAALRTAYKLLTGTELEDVEIKAVRGLEGVREAEIEIAGIKVRAAVANGLANARALMEKVKAGETYHFIEIMACPGGCIGGGGQPQPTSPEIRAKRIEAIYAEDRGLAIRRSHENPAVATLYAEFLGEPLSHKSHELLHTHYTPRGTQPTTEKPVKVKVE
jgi:NADH-quinone oxidoreductase subunit G/NADP-reducing hydrogenase subunit HndD